MGGLVNQWVDGLTDDGRVDEWVNELMDGARIDGWFCGLTGVSLNG